MVGNAPVDQGYYGSYLNDGDCYEYYVYVHFLRIYRNSCIRNIYEGYLFVALSKTIDKNLTILEILDYEGTKNIYIKKKN